MTIANLPFTTCDVTIYCASGTDNGQFAAKTVNGTTYTCDAAGNTVEGTDAWGRSKLYRITQATSTDGNALTIRGVSCADGTLTISGGAQNGAVRGCIAAVKIVNTQNLKTATITSATGDDNGLVWWAGVWDDGTVPSATDAVVIRVGAAGKTLARVNDVSLGSLRIESTAADPLTTPFALQMQGGVMTVGDFFMNTPVTLVGGGANPGALDITGTTVATAPLTIDMTGATSDWTAGVALKKMLSENLAFVTRDTRIILKGEDHGVDATFANATHFRTHVEVASGVHTFKVAYDGTSTFNNNSSNDNPLWQVDSGATLNFIGKDIGGWIGAAGAASSVIRVNNGGTLNLKSIDSSTFYYFGRFCLEPGSVLSLAQFGNSKLFRVNGGGAAGDEQFYVPDQDEPATVPARITRAEATDYCLSTGDDGTKGVGFYVGANGVLDVEVPIARGNGGNDHALYKRGAGELILRAIDSTCASPITIAGGTLSLGATPTRKITVQSGATLNVLESLAISTEVALNDAKLTVSEGKTLALGTVSSVGGIRELVVEEDATLELAVPAGGRVRVGKLIGSGTIVKKGAGALVIDTETDHTEFTGTINAENGVIDFVDLRDLSVLDPFDTVSEDVVLRLAATRADILAGQISVSNVPEGVTTIAVDLGDAVISVDLAENRTILPIPDHLGGVACFADMVFDHTGAVLTYASYAGLGISYDTNATLNETEDGVYLKHHPWFTGFADSDKGSFITQPAITIALVGTMPASKKTTFFHIGSTTGSNKGIIVATDETLDNTVNFYTNSGATLTPITSMMVPNAATAPHSYIITKEDVTIDDVAKSRLTVYLDGQKWKTVVVDRMTLSGGVQVGSDFGGSLKNNHNLEAVADSDTGCIKIVRFYDCVITPDEIASYATMYPYDSPNGTSRRTFTGNAKDWIDDTEGSEVWSVSGTGETVKTGAPATGSSLELTTTAGVKTTVMIALDEHTVYESLAVGGAGSIEFVRAADAAGYVDPSSTARIGCPVTIQYGAVDISGAPTVLLEDGRLTFDLSTFDASSCTVTTFVPLTGETEEAAEGVVSIVWANKPDGCDAKLGYDAENHRYGFTFTPDRMNGTDVYYKSGYLNNPCTTSEGFLIQNAVGTPISTLKTTDVLVIDSSCGNTTMAWVGAAYPGNAIRIDKDFALASGQNVGAILDSVVLTVASDMTLTFDTTSQWTNPMSLGAVTLNGGSVVFETLAVASVAGTSPITIAANKTVTCAGAIANPVVLNAGATLTTANLIESVTTDAGFVKITRSPVAESESFTYTYEVVTSGTDLTIAEGIWVKVCGTNAAIGALSGAGTLAVDGAAVTIASFDGWTGTVELPVLNNAGYVNLNTFGVTGSCVALKGTTGNYYINSGNSPTVNPAIRLDGDISVNNGSSPQTVTYTKVSGTGNMSFTWASGNGLSVVINELTDYTGTITATEKMTTTITKLVYTGEQTDGAKLLGISTAEGLGHVTVSAVVDGENNPLAYTAKNDGLYLLLANAAQKYEIPLDAVGQTHLPAGVDPAAVAIVIPDATDAGIVYPVTDVMTVSIANGVVTATLNEAAAPTVSAMDPETDALDNEAIAFTFTPVPGLYYAVVHADTVAGDYAECAASKQQATSTAPLTIRLPFTELENAQGVRPAAQFFKIRVTTH